MRGSKAGMTEDQAFVEEAWPTWFAKKHVGW